MTATTVDTRIEFRLTDPLVECVFYGDWLIASDARANADVQLNTLLGQGQKIFTLNVTQVQNWDTRLIAEIHHLQSQILEAGGELLLDNLRDNQRKLLEMTRARAADTEEPRTNGKSLLDRLGTVALEQWRGCLSLASFTGDWMLALLRLLLGRSSLRLKEFLPILRSVSTSALGIVSLISFLVGLIIAFLGAVVLRQFGAEFAVAYLVGYGMLREMGAIMTGVIMAGRTGSAFAAQLGSMKINEEIDALRTFGISPMDTLVLPRILATVLMMPLLTIYANIVGIFGGYLIADLFMGVPRPLFFSEMKLVVGPNDFLLGLFKALVFGGLVATAGCLRGMQCGKGADAVGVAATRAVVTGITLIIIANAVIDWFAATYSI